MDSTSTLASISLTPVTLGIVVIAILALLLITWRVLRRGTSESERRQRQLDALDTLQAWHPSPTRLLTRGQRIVYSTLCRAVPEYMIFAQVPLQRFLRVPTRHSYAEWMNRVGHLCPDFVVCDAASEVIAVIDVRLPESQASVRSRERQARIQKVLKAAAVPYHIWRDDAVPSASAAREVIVRVPMESPESSRSTTIPGGLVDELRKQQRTPAPVPARADAGHSDYPIPDEVIELGGDPPPSTWFDQISQSPARHAPLRSSSSRRDGTDGQQSSTATPNAPTGKVPGAN
jgi:hypothetical protein